MDIHSWFAVRCIFRHRGFQTDGLGFVYEERIVLVRATGLDLAIEKAEQEANIYASDKVEYLKLAQAYEIPSDTLNDGTEVFSLMRSSSLEPSAYLDHFFDTRSEHSR